MCIGANQGWRQFAGGTATLSGDRKGQERAQRDAKAITLVRCSKISSQSHDRTFWLAKTGYDILGETEAGCTPSTLCWVSLGSPLSIPGSVELSPALIRGVPFAFALWPRRPGKI